jgi:hypothetical protein
LLVVTSDRVDEKEYQRIRRLVLGTAAYRLRPSVDYNMTAINQVATPGRLGALFRTTSRRDHYNPNKDTNQDCAARTHKLTRVSGAEGGAVRRHVARHSTIGSWWRDQQVTNMQHKTPQPTRISLQSCLHRSFPGSDVVVKGGPRRAKE